jgi:hypothetical protein
VIDRLYLSLMIGPLIAMPAPPEVVDAFRGAQVTVSSGARTGFQITFAVSRKSLLTTTLIPAGYFDPGIRVILVVAVNGVPTPVIDGLITRQEVGISDTIGQSVLTVTGEDVSIAMDLVKFQGIPMPPLPAAGRVAAIIGMYAPLGMLPVVVPEIFPFVSLPTERIEMQQGTHLEYVTKLAQENGYVFYVEPGPVPGMNTAYWGPEIRVGVPQPALNVDFDAGSNVQSLNFSFDGLQRTTYVVTVQEPLSKAPVPIPLPALDPLRPPLAARPATALRVDLTQDTAKLSPVEALARGVALASSSADAVTGQGQLDVIRYGRVLKARSLVGVRGAGAAYDGLYYVKSVTHDIKPGAYTQSFTLARNGLLPLTSTVVP